MTDSAIFEMIAAFAVGCMDKENFLQLKEYMLSGGDLPNEELGELQNIVSMIPIILDLEKPEPSIKESVAKKLISLQSEIRSKIRGEKYKTTTQYGKTVSIASFKGVSKESPVMGPPKTKGTNSRISKSTIPIKQKEKLESKEESPSTAEKEIRKGIAPLEQPQSLLAYQAQQVQPPVQQDKSGSNIAGWIAILLTIILFSILGYYTYSSVESLNRDTEELKQSIPALRNELSNASSFMSNYISLIEFFNNKNVSVLELSSSDPNEKASARVLLAFKEKEGLVQFKNARQLQPNQGYQLWVVSKGQSYSMGVYSPSGNEYMRLASFPIIPKEQFETLKVTIESNTGSPTPSIQNYLAGSFSAQVKTR